MANDDNTPNESTDTKPTDRRRSRSARGGGRNKPDAPDPSKLNFFRIVPENTRIEFVKNRRKGLIFSLILILIALGTMVGRVANGQDALNYGIDFQGGSSVRIALTQPADIEQMRDLLDEAGYSGSWSSAPLQVSSSASVMAMTSLTRISTSLSWSGTATAELPT